LAGWSPSCANKAIDAIFPENPIERALMHQEIQVGKRLTEREPHLVSIEGSPEQNLDQFERGLRDMASGNHIITASPMVRGKAVDARVQAEKRKVVGGQRKRLAWHRISQLG